MRIALCLYGMIGSKYGNGLKKQNLSPSIAARYYKKNIINYSKKNKVDVFIHSWSYDYKEKLIKLYKPKEFIFEKQKNYKSDLINKISKKRISYKDYLKDLFNFFFYKKKYYERVKHIKETTYRGLSRWYSSKKSIELVEKYLKNKNLKYDFIMVSRFDVAFYKPILFNKYDPEKFWVSYWNDNPTAKIKKSPKKNNVNIGTHLMDLWFFSNQSNMIKFSKLFDHAENYHYSPHISSLEHINFLKLDISYTLCKWFDYDLIRRAFFKSTK